MSIRQALLLALACLTGCAAQQQVPSWQQDYQNAFNRPEFETKVTVEHRPLTQKELAKQEAGRKQLATLPRRTSEIIVTAGPIYQPYEALGEVHADSSGVIALGELLTDTIQYGMFGTTSGRSSSPSVHTETMDSLLREEAIRLYGDKVDAIVNVVYRTNPNGRVDASGLAVRFVEPIPAASPARSVEERLKELQGLLDKGLITQEEYERKRAEILNEL